MPRSPKTLVAIWLAIILGIGVASAETWVQVYSQNDGKLTFHLDRDSITRDGMIRSARVKEIMWGTLVGPGWVKVDCANRQDDWSGFWKPGAPGSTPGWTNVMSGYHESAVYDYLCGQ